MFPRLEDCIARPTGLFGDLPDTLESILTDISDTPYTFQGFQRIVSKDYSLDCQVFRQISDPFQDSRTFENGFGGRIYIYAYESKMHKPVYHFLTCRESGHPLKLLNSPRTGSEVFDVAFSSAKQEMIDVGFLNSPRSGSDVFDVPFSSAKQEMVDVGYKAFD